MPAKFCFHSLGVSSATPEAGGGLAITFGVVTVEGIEDVLFGGELGADFEFREGLDGVDGFEIQRVCHGEGEGTFVDGDGEEK